MNKERVIKPEIKFPRIPNNIFLFRSCTGSLEYPGTENGVVEVLKLLGTEIITDPDQTCCSGYLLTCSGYPAEFSLAVTARNLAIIEQKNVDTYTFCNGCYGYLRELSHILLENKPYMEMANQVISRWGYQYMGKTQIYHVQELYYRLIDQIAAKVVRPLHGLRVAAHYGCHYVAQQYGILDDGGYPTFHEKIYEALGATPVFYKERQACCGYAVGRGFTHREELVQPHLYTKFISAQEEGVELMTTVCPGCNTALDREQARMAERGMGKFNIPVVDLGQLIALAMGVPIEKLGFQANTISLNGILAKLGIEGK